MLQSYSCHDDENTDTVKSKLEQLSVQPLKFKHKSIVIPKKKKLAKKRCQTHYKHQVQHDDDSFTSSNDSAEINDQEFEIYDQNLRSNILTKYRNSYMNEKIQQFNLVKHSRSFPIMDKQLSQKSIGQSSSNLKEQAIQKQISFKLTSFHSLKLVGSSPSSQTSRDMMQNSPLKQSAVQVVMNMQANFVNQSQYSRFSMAHQQSINSNYTIDIPINIENISNHSQSRLPNISDMQIQQQLIDMIFSKNIARLNQLLMLIQKDYRNDVLNVVDHKGNTPLFLAIKLGYQSNYFEIVRLLLLNGADPSIKDSEGWTPIEESVAQLDIVTTSLIFEHLVRKKQMEFQQERVKIDQQLIHIDDFYIEMKWEFQSNIIPFLSRFAPSDVFKIYKKSTSLRLDTTYVGTKKYKTKRRDLSVLYNPMSGNHQRHENQGNCKFVAMLNKSKGIYFYPMQDIDPEEKKLILIDLLNCDSVSGQMKVVNCQLNKSKSFFGGAIKEQVGQWNCSKYEFKVKTEECFSKKNHQPFLCNMEQYLQSPKFEVVKSAGKCNVETIASRILFDSLSVQRQESIQSVDTKKQSSKSCQLFITQEFPISFYQFLPIIKMLSKGNQFMQSMETIFQDEQINKVISQNGFPVKIQIPINFSIDAVVTFQAYRKLDSYDEQSNQYFEIPNNLVHTNRKDAQKLMQREKKRLLLANLYL